MDKQGFLRVLKTIQASTPADAETLSSLTLEYPYSQAIQVLAAKALHDHDRNGAAAQLTRSATYSSDRSVLKHIMSLPRIPTQATTPSEAESPDGELLRDELSRDLRRLKKLKGDFEHALEKFEHQRSRELSDEASARPGKKDTSKATGKASEKIKKKAGEGKKIKKGRPTRKEVKKKEIPEINSDLLLSRIEKYRGKPKKNIKHRNQIEIIDRFIKRQPTIERKPLSGKNDLDLSQKSVELTSEVVSNTLVDLLVKQGKKERAIEVLKKLIWKFPQKKAIFAARIEDLKR